jgi:N utilization substance protein B
VKFGAYSYVVSPRRRARILALQTLYEVQLTGHDPMEVLQRNMQEESLPEDTRTFAEELVRGVLENQRFLDKLISEAAPTWPIEQMSAIDLNILRIAIFEILLYRRSPIKSSINEAVELAKAFGTDSSGRFVNGVLGTIVSQYHGGE